MVYLAFCNITRNERYVKRIMIPSDGVVMCAILLKIAKMHCRKPMASLAYGMQDCPWVSNDGENISSTFNK